MKYDPTISNVFFYNSLYYYIYIYIINHIYVSIHQFIYSTFSHAFLSEPTFLEFALWLSGTETAGATKDSRNWRATP